jgi:pimeloyl-ACP methyl ester carboxylesterase
VREDDLGFMYHVWARTEGDQTYVVMAFRGTSGASDWMSGNLWWFTRWFRTDDQYSRAAAHAREVVAYFDAQAAAAGRNKPIFLTTGHSLGGGLAQHVLYALPQRVRQAIVFDPTAVTASAGVSAEDFDAACNCAELYPETRFLRVYENYEILSVLRIFHKTFLGPERHVQELRFSFEGAWNPVGRHGMNFFASHLQSLAARQPVAPSGQHWIRSENQSCTDGLLLGQRASCALPSQSGSLIHRCPR